MMKPQMIAEDEARRILQRAAEIDRQASEHVSIETLRTAAREAGITEAAFDAAVQERDVVASTEGVSRRRFFLGAAAVAATAALAVFIRERAVPRPERRSERPFTRSTPDTPLAASRPR